jgi:3'-phosphoadenosine 5'-phosphosulfate sulfotransferase (PAPS reductase)/FAD synthetase
MFGTYWHKTVREVLAFVPEGVGRSNAFGVKNRSAPRQKFRWCTERLKIRPSNHFIRPVVHEAGALLTER